MTKLTKITNAVISTSSKVLLFTIPFSSLLVFVLGLFTSLDLMASVSGMPINQTSHAILAELLACSAKSSKPVNACNKQYKLDRDQYGKPVCCAFEKLV